MNRLQKYTSVLTLVTIVFFGTFYFANALGVIDGILWSMVNAVFGRLLALAGFFLNYSIDEFVVGFGDSFKSNGIGASVNLLWQIIRDIFNLTFIFGLVYIGFKMILSSDDSNTKQWLIRLIMAALLVNFSLFITKFVVDISNITASQIVINGFNSATDPNTGRVGTAVSETFMDNLGITSIWGTNPPAAVANGGGSAYGYIFGTAIIFIVAAFVFAAGAFMLTIRFVALILYMVFSPLMFIGWVFPQLQSVSRSYWKGFLSKAFFAPVYLLMIYFSATVIGKYYGSLGSKPDFQAVWAGTGSAAKASFGNTFPPFIISAILLIASVIIANKMGAQGAQASLAVGKKLRGSAQRGLGNASFGTAAWAGRKTVGQAAERYANSERGRRWASKSLVAKGALHGARGVAGSSFDARNVGGFGKAAGIGTGKTGGYTKAIKDKTKADEEFMKSLGENNIYDESGKIKSTYNEEIAKDIQNDEIVKRANDLKETASAKADEKDRELKDQEAIITKKTGPLKKELAQMETELKSITNDDERSAKQQQITRQKTQISGVEKEFSEELQKATQTAEEARADVKDATAYIKTAINSASATAESKAVYSKQINYMEKLESNKRFWLSPTAKLSGSAAGNTTGVAGGLATTGAGAGAVAAGGAGLLIGAAFTSSKAHENNVSAQNLRKIWGKDGQKMAKTNQTQKEMKILAAEMAKLNVNQPAANDSDTNDQSQAA